MKGPLAVTLVAMLLLVAVVSSSSEEQPKKERLEFSTRQGKASAEILFDTWGVPHIFAESFESLVSPE